MSGDEAAVARATLRKVFWRTVPLLMLGSAMSYIDRVNLGFAALTMNQELGLGPAIYGLAAGAFYLTYSLFEVPSNMIMARVGARIWLARIMITWGLVSAATALAHDAQSLIFIRLLLGLAEAGFTPGVLVYITFWFPKMYRGRVISAFLAAQVIGLVLGSTVSGPLLALDALGLSGWQWMFIIEGIPAVLGGLALLRFLDDDPRKARWLKDSERDWLVSTLETERQAVARGGAEPRVLKALISPRVLLLTVGYFLAATCMLALVFFLPQVIEGAGLSLTSTGFATGFAWCLAGVLMFAWGGWADRTKSPEGVAALACVTLAAGLAGMAAAKEWIFLLPMICVATIGSKGVLSTFWPIPPTFLHGATVGVVIAAINTIGNMGGLIGPPLFGWLREHSTGFSQSLWLAAATALLAAVLIAVSRAFDRRQATEEAEN